MRNRCTGTPMLVGGSLIALVAVATCVVAWLLWARAEERGRADDDRAAQATVERLQNSVGRVLTSLRTSAGLVNAKGNVDAASSTPQPGRRVDRCDRRAGARRDGPIRRARRVEAARGRRISELSEPGVFRGARIRRRPTSSRSSRSGRSRDAEGSARLRHDGEPARRPAIEQAESGRRTAFTGIVPFVTGGSGLQAFRAVYAPTQESRRSVGYVSAWFGRRVVARSFATFRRRFARA